MELKQIKSNKTAMLPLLIGNYFIDMSGKRHTTSTVIHPGKRNPDVRTVRSKGLR